MQKSKINLDGVDYVNELYMASRQDESDVTIDTPVGNYVHESVVATAFLKVGDKVLWDDCGRLSGDDRVFEVYEVRDDMVKIASGEPTDEGYSEAEVPIDEVTKLRTITKFWRK